MDIEYAVVDPICGLVYCDSFEAAKTFAIGIDVEQVVEQRWADGEVKETVIHYI